jgi:DNA-directed RNA polymerase subunit RPC12/RpoP
MCSYGGCSSFTCEKCYPKLVTCPDCGHKTLLQFNTCLRCKAPISEELKKAAIAQWHAAKERAAESPEGDQQA